MAWFVDTREVGSGEPSLGGSAGSEGAKSFATISL